MVPLPLALPDVVDEEAQSSKPPTRRSPPQSLITNERTSLKSSTYGSHSPSHLNPHPPEPPRDYGATFPTWTPIQPLP